MGVSTSIRPTATSSDWGELEGFEVVPMVFSAELAAYSAETFIHEVWPQIARQSGQAWEDFTKEDYDTLQHLLGKLLNRLGN